MQRRHDAHTHVVMIQARRTAWTQALDELSLRPGNVVNRSEGLQMYAVYIGHDRNTRPEVCAQLGNIAPLAGSHFQDQLRVRPEVSIQHRERKSQQSIQIARRGHN